MTRTLATFAIALSLVASASVAQADGSLMGCMAIKATPTAGAN
jgi:hypothetical protein